MPQRSINFDNVNVALKDRQNVDVIAHELAHSWSGNLVTNASWEHFWLNEGWTTYLERRVRVPTLYFFLCFCGWYSCCMK